MSSIWKLDTDDEEKELQLELAYQRSLTTQQRFEMMFRKSREMAEMLQQSLTYQRGYNYETD